MNFKGFILLFLTMIYLPFTFALEIDEKLTLRILSVSESKKTILINRGIEDGLVVGDHAKLFLTTGVVGRAVVIKVSPTRSIWSVYRLVNPQFIVSDRVLNLKIASPLKITEDSSKALVVERRIPEGAENIKIIRGRDESSLSKAQAFETDQADLRELQETPTVSSSSYGTNIYTKSWEVFGTVSLSSYGGSREFEEGSTDISQTFMDFSVGIEKYFWSQTGFMKNLSIFGLFNSRSNSSSTSSGNTDSTTKESTNEFGGGGNYYFYNSPYQYSKVLGFASLSFGMGSASRTVETSVSNVDDDDLSGKSSFLSLGIGGKFFLRNQFGAIAMVDYSKLSTTFEYEDSGSENTNLSGIRFKFGLAYRF